MKEYRMTEDPTTEQEPTVEPRSAEFVTAELIGKVIITARKQGQLPETLNLKDMDQVARLGSLVAPYVLSIADQFLNAKLQQMATNFDQLFVDIFGTGAEPGGEAGPPPTPTGKPE